MKKKRKKSIAKLFIAFWTLLETIPLLIGDGGFDGFVLFISFSFSISGNGGGGLKGGGPRPFSGPE